MRHLLALVAAVLFAGAALPAMAQSSSPYAPAQYQQPYQQQYQQPYQQPQYGQSQPYGYGRPQPYGEERRRRGGIDILSAWYSIERRACDATRVASRICEGKSECTIPASNRLCGDPMPNVVKVLTVDYRCHGRVRSTTRWEGGYVGLRCD